MELAIWIGFGAFIAALLAVDLLVFQRNAHEVSVREAAWWSAVWITLGLSFTLVILYWKGSQAAGEYLAGYLIEKSLSIDNIFVFTLLFSYFAVPKRSQHRVLFWGVFGALVFRAIFIAGGAALLSNFHFMIYVFGLFLVYTGIKICVHKEFEVHPDKNPVLKVMRRLIPITKDYHGEKFFTRAAGRRVATPLFAVLVVIETTDIIFALDSIPAIFAVTRDTFIIFSSNAFAILGLRALYFLFARLVDKFRYLNVGIGAVLVFVGLKMLADDFFHVPIWLSLLVIVACIGTAMLVSLVKAPHEHG